MKGHKHVFDVCTVDRTYHLAAESAEEKNEWIITLKDMLFTEVSRGGDGGSFFIVCVCV